MSNRGNNHPLDQMTRDQRQELFIQRLREDCNTDYIEDITPIRGTTIEITLVDGVAPNSFTTNAWVSRKGYGENSLVVEPNGDWWRNHVASLARSGKGTFGPEYSQGSVSDW